MTPAASSVPPEKDLSESDNQHSADAGVYRDDTFYFDLVTFKVENCLFRVPKHELVQQSTVFLDMFALPLGKDGENSEPEGTSDSNPIQLYAVEKNAFKVLLKLLYPPNSEDVSSTLTFHQCASLYSLSRRWDFERILLIAKNRIRLVLWDSIPCDEKIKFIHDNEIKEWYADAYRELATRVKTLSIEEGRSLGLEFSIKMGQVRERVAGCRYGSEKEKVARKAVDEIFFTECSNSHPAVNEDEEVDTTQNKKWHRRR